MKVSDAMKRQAEQLAMQGKTPLFCKDEKLLGVIAVADVIKEDSRVRWQNCRTWESMW